MCDQGYLRLGNACFQSSATSDKKCTGERLNQTHMSEAFCVVHNKGTYEGLTSDAFVPIERAALPPDHACASVEFSNRVFCAPPATIQATFNAFDRSNVTAWAADKKPTQKVPIFGSDAVESTNCWKRKEAGADAVILCLPQGDVPQSDDITKLVPPLHEKVGQGQK